MTQSTQSLLNFPLILISRQLLRAEIETKVQSICISAFQLESKIQEK